MNLIIDTDDRRPVYQQIADGIRTLIATGTLANGQQLPSVRQVAADLGVNLNTVAAAYRELEEDGLITIKHGSGATVRPRIDVKHDIVELRAPLRNALTHMVLSGLRRGEILSMVHDELRGLLKGART